MDGYVLETTFLEVIWWMFIGFFLLILVSMFIQLFADIFTRPDLSGWGKAGWSLFIFALPLIGIIFYLAFRPKLVPGETGVPAGVAPVNQADKANQLLQSGALSPAEYEDLKRRGLG